MQSLHRWLGSVALLAWSTAAWAGMPAPGYEDTQVASGLSQPTAIAFLPDGRLLITEKAGALKLKGAGAPTTLATIPVCSNSEMGLLGIAVDPSFTSNGYIYLYRTESAGGCSSASGRSNEVIRVTMDPGDTVNLASLTVLLTGMRTDNGNHDGGVLLTKQLGHRTDGDGMGRAAAVDGRDFGAPLADRLSWIAARRGVIDGAIHFLAEGVDGVHGLAPRGGQEEKRIVKVAAAAFGDGVAVGLGVGGGHDGVAA